VHTILYCHHYSKISGGETSLLELWRNLDREKFRPILAGPEYGPFADEARKLGVKICPIEFGRLRQGVLLLKNIASLRAIAQIEGAAILHSNGPVTNLPAGIAARLLGLPAIWHARVMNSPGQTDLDRLLSPLSSLIIANSDAIRERFRRRGTLPQKAVTIINGVDIQNFHPSSSGEGVRKQWDISSGDILAGVVGRISPVKGQETFIEAAARLAPEFQNLRFILIGSALFEKEKEYELKIRRLVADKGLEKKIIFAGYQSDVASYMSALDICVVPSDEEGCGRAIFEAMAMAKPVVGTNTGGTPEIVVEGETGLLIHPRDAETLAGAIKKLAYDDGIRARMGEAGRRRVEENFTIEDHTRKTESQYLRLIDKGVDDG